MRGLVFRVGPGMRTQTLLEWSKRNVVFSKVLLGLFFLAMAVLIAVL